MDFKTDIFLRHENWQEAECLVSKSNGLFGRMVDLFVVACTIGVKDDKIIENIESHGKEYTIGRNTIAMNPDINNLLTFLYENAILSSKTIDLSNDDRKKAAFDPDRIDLKFTPSNFLARFAEYGIGKIVECITDNDLETINNIYTLLDDYKNFDTDLVDLDDISDFEDDDLLDIEE